MFHGRIGVDFRRIKGRDRAILGSDQQADLRASQDNALGSLPHKVAHDLGVPFLGSLLDLPEAQFVVDDTVSIAPAGVLR